MEMDELRRSLECILAVEEQEPSDWLEVERLSGELQQKLHIDATPEVVRHYLDDADIRAKDHAYGVRQRREIRRFIESGEYHDGTPVPLWGCALVFLIGASLILWLVM